MKQNVNTFVHIQRITDAATLDYASTTIISAMMSTTVRMVKMNLIAVVRGSASEEFPFMKTKRELPRSSKMTKQQPNWANGVKMVFDRSVRDR